MTITPDASSPELIRAQSAPLFQGMEAPSDTGRVFNGRRVVSFPNFQERPPSRPSTPYLRRPSTPNLQLPGIPPVHSAQHFARIVEEAATKPPESLKERELVDAMAFKDLTMEKISAKAKRAEKIVFWLQVAGMILTVVAPILGLTLVWWVALPLLVAGVGLCLLSWYFLNVQNKHREAIAAEDEKKQLVFAELLLERVNRASQQAEAVGAPGSELMSISENFASLKQVLVKIIEGYLPWELTRLKRIKRFNEMGIDGFTAAKTRAAAFPVASGSTKLGGKSLQRLEEMGQLHNRKVFDLNKFLFDKKKDSAHSGRVSFWLRIVGLVVGAVAPILALAVIWWAALPCMVIGLLTYFISMHFTDRKAKAEEDLAQSRAVEAELTITQQILDKHTSVLDAEANKACGIIQKAFNKPARRIAEDGSFTNEKTSLRLLDSLGIVDQPAYGKTVALFTFDQRAMVDVLMTEFAALPKKTLPIEPLRMEWLMRRMAMLGLVLRKR